jgi:hypothetical protein
MPMRPRLKPMKNSKAVIEDDPLAPRPLDLSKAVRGKYYAPMQEGSNLVVIAPDLMEAFPDSDAVNEALRSLKSIADRTPKRA